jgi:hypothetical protein
MSGDEQVLEDLEAQWGQARGYDRMALMMGSHPETAIFRRFLALSAENLLYLQAEINDLETDFHEAQKADRESSLAARREYQMNWYQLQSSVDVDGSGTHDGTQWTLALEIRQKLKYYRISSQPWIFLVPTR